MYMMQNRRQAPHTQAYVIGVEAILRAARRLTAERSCAQDMLFSLKFFSLFSSSSRLRAASSGSFAREQRIGWRGFV